MQQPHVLTSANDKSAQCTITVAQVMKFPAIQLALANMNRWTPAIKTGVANVLSNRTAFNINDTTSAENEQFDKLMAKVERCMAVDARFAELMDPSYVIVDFGGATVPVGYRGWLDQINANLGGLAVGAAGPDKFNVTADTNQPIALMDPNLSHLNLLHVNTRYNADKVAGELQMLGGLSSWVLESNVAPNYR